MATISCQNESTILPENLPLDSTFVSVNGQIRNFQNASYSFKLEDNQERLSLVFSEKLNNGLLVYTVGGITYRPVLRDDYVMLQFNREESDRMQLSFFQIVAEDLPGVAYEYFPRDEDFFSIEKYDTINDIVAGRGEFTLRKVFLDQNPGELDYWNFKIAFNVTYQAW
jgi:hypothetical protein